MSVIDSTIRNKSLLTSASQTADARPTFRRPKIVLPVPMCSYFIRNYKRSNFYDQIQHSPFQNS